MECKYLLYTVIIHNKICLQKKPSFYSMEQQSIIVNINFYNLIKKKEKKPLN